VLNLLLFSLNFQTAVAFYARTLPPAPGAFLPALYTFWPTDWTLVPFVVGFSILLSLVFEAGGMLFC
jgi:hypothetical protein